MTTPRNPQVYIFRKAGLLTRLLRNAFPAEASGKECAELSRRTETHSSRYCRRFTRHSLLIPTGGNPSRKPCGGKDRQNIRKASLSGKSMRKNIPPDPFLGSSTRHGHNFLTCPFRFGKIVVSLHYPNWSPDRSTQPERRQIPHPRRNGTVTYILIYSAKMKKHLLRYALLCLIVPATAGCVKDAADRIVPAPEPDLIGFDYATSSVSYTHLRAHET